MTHLRSGARSRTLTVVLPEEDWQALRAVEPDAVAWLQACISQRLGRPAAAEGAAARPVSPRVDGWGEDEY